MSQPTSYSYPPYSLNSSPPKQYPAAHSMSSAFSASANPNEDWTKISDLAERRRIQNRIAQRNYRKKLKKRLEDLERRAGSSSASPEAQPAELVKMERRSQSSRAIPIPDTRTRLPNRPADIYGSQYTIPDDRMFSQQYTRQISTSPPPFSYATMPSTEIYAPYQQNGFCNLSMDQTIHTQYMPQHFTQLATPPIKSEYYTDDEMNPFSMSYASISNVDIPSAPSYQDGSPYTPPLLDCLELSSVESPTGSTDCPPTPPLYQ